MTSRCTVTRALEKVGWNDGATGIVRSLNRGPLSDTWLIERDGEPFVLRLDTPLADTLSLNRATEPAAIACAADAGLTPGMVFAAPGDGILLRPHVAGKSWDAQALQQPANLVRLAATLRVLHALHPALRVLDLAGAMRGYALHLDHIAGANWARIGEQLLRSIERPCEVLCHGDLTAGNLIEGERLWLIDWEFAGLGDPYLDLATVVRHHGLGTKLRERFLSAYLEETPTRRDLERLSIWCSVYDCLSVLWFSVIGLHRELPAAEKIQLAEAIGRIEEIC